MVGNKGAVAVSFTYNFRSFLFINCHLAAGHNQCSKRNKDFERINNELRLDNTDFIEGKTLTDQHDIVIWSGDFNYRIDADKTFVDMCLEDKSDFLVNSLIEYDQMANEINNSNLKINRFAESRIKFFPTYKLIPETDNYNIKESLPGWTDRIIYKSAVRSFLQIKEYNWIKEIKSSDHRPVFGIFEVNLPKNSKPQTEKPSNLKSSKACLLF